MASGGSLSDPLLPRAVSERVRSGELLLRVNKKSKGSHAWDQFRLVWDPVDNQEVRGIACCSVCKSCLHKTSLNGEEKSLGTKNMLDHIKNCTPSSSSSVTSSSDGATSSSSTTVCPKSSWPEVPGQFC